MKRYYSHREKRVGFIYVAIVLFTWSILIIPVFQLEDDPLLFWVLIVVAGSFTYLLMDIWTCTYYTIASGKLHWYSGHLISGHVEISSIRRVSTDKNVLTVNGAFKPTLSYTSNLTISYNQYDELLIAPEERSAFIKELIKSNPAIEVMLSKQDIKYS